MALTLLVAIATATPNVASAHTATSATASRICAGFTMTPYYDSTVYDRSHPWLHHYWVKANFTSPDLGARTTTNPPTAWIFFYNERGSWEYMHLTSWAHTNAWGISEAWIPTHPAWSSSNRWYLSYTC